MTIDLSRFVVTGDGDREQIQHPFHQHPLKLLPLVPDRWWSCTICNLGFTRQQIWHCEQNCIFFAHKNCLLYSFPETVQLKHGSQVAYWSLLTPSYFSREPCGDCDKSLCSNPHFRTGGDNGSEYLCITCCLVRKLVGDDEESSLQVAKVIHHFFHPCALELTFSPSTTCNACFLNHSHLSYYCKDCHFFLDFECAQLPEVSHVDDDSNQIHHFCHWHPLQLFPDEAIDGETLCQLCESYSSSSRTTDPFYGCIQCQFFAHKSCIDILPQKIDHPLLDDTVVLLTVPSYVCSTCDRACSGLAFFYSGGDYFCVKCILQCRNEVGVFKSIQHRHLLRSWETDEVDKSHCFLCKKECSSWNYKCRKCSVYFHKSCAEFPREIQHPFHPRHPLTLVSEEGLHGKCWLCLKANDENYYGCSRCEFYLDFPCTSLFSSIQYQGHPHLLCVVDNLSQDGTRCQKCPETLPTDSPVLRCAECDFNLHLECGPLPCRIKDPRHVHPLTFQEYYVEDNDMSDLFACHICEKKREARRPVYLCKDGCFITCEVKCVLREVVASLRGERGVMELDTVYPKVACKIMTGDSNLEGITCSSSRENVATDVHVFSFEELIQRVDFGFDLGLLEEGNNKLNPGIYDLRGDSSSRSYYNVGEYPYSRKDFMHYIKNFEGIYYDRDDLREIFTKHDRSCTGGDYLLPNTLHSA